VKRHRSTFGGSGKENRPFSSSIYFVVAVLLNDICGALQILVCEERNVTLSGDFLFCEKVAS